MIKTFTIAAALFGSALMAAPASAAPLSATSGLALTLADSGNGLVETVQYRRYGYGYRGGYYRGGRGSAIGAGIAAGAIGALAAGAIASQARPVYGAPVYGAYGAEDVDAIAYCSRRFRSYDPETGTYIAAGGVVRACP